MTVVNGYCTLQELQSWNQATTAGAVNALERAIEAASRSIDQYCERTFWQTATGTSRDFTACSATRLEFDDLHAITALATDEAGDGTFETTWAASDYELLPVNRLAGPEEHPWTSMSAVAARRFPLPQCTGRQARVRVTGTWGWPAVPAAVAQACLMLSARLFIRKESPQGVAGFGEFGVVRVRASDPDVAALLDPYRRHAVLIA